MITRKPLLAAVTLAIAFAASAAFAAGETPAAPPATHVAAAITKDQATEMALKAHPGKVTKAYEDAHKG
ncbi:MAG: PepSY domain-containing protein, partial [Streptococcus sp.]|nr:PepSY domain-containing protein [Streptococcus sp.]